MSEVASCLALAVREGLATRDDVLLAIVGVSQGDENAEEILSMLTTYGRLRRAGEIDAYVSTDTNLPSDWEVTDEELAEFFNNLGGN
jgi:hypothetical protein